MAVAALAVEQHRVAAATEATNCEWEGVGPSTTTDWGNYSEFVFDIFLNYYCFKEQKFCIFSNSDVPENEHLNIY